MLRRGYRSLAAVALLVAAAGNSQADQGWTQPEHAHNFPLDGLPAPSSAANPPTAPELHGGHGAGTFPASTSGLLSDISCGVSAAIPQWTGAGWTCTTAAAALVTGTPNTVAAFDGSGILGGLSPQPPLAVVAGNLEVDVDGSSIGVSGSNLQWIGLNAGPVRASSGSSTSSFANEGALTWFGNGTNGSAAPTFIGPGTAGEVPIVNAAGTAAGWGFIPQTSIVAPYATKGVAYTFFVDYDGGSDSNDCLTNSTPCKTFDGGIEPKIPSDLGGGSIFIHALPRASCANYLKANGSTVEDFATLNRIANASSVIILGDWFRTGSAPSFGMSTIPTGTNAAGYDVTSYSAGAPGPTITVTIHGGGAPGFVSETSGSTTLLGRQWRWDPATTTVALRNTSSTVMGTTTNSITLSAPPAGTPVAGDLGYIEAACFTIGTAQVGASFPGGAGLNSLYEFFGVSATTLDVEAVSDVVFSRVTAATGGVNFAHTVIVASSRFWGSLNLGDITGSDSINNVYFGLLNLLRGVQPNVFQFTGSAILADGVYGPGAAVNGFLGSEATAVMNIGDVPGATTHTQSRLMTVGSSVAGIYDFYSNLRVGSVNWEDPGTPGLFFPVNLVGQGNTLYVDGITNTPPHGASPSSWAAPGIIDLQPGSPVTAPQPPHDNNVILGPHQTGLADAARLSPNADIHLSSVSPLDGVIRVQYTLQLDTLKYVGAITTGDGNRFYSYASNGLGSVKAWSGLWDPDLTTPTGPPVTNDLGRFRVARASSTPGLLVLADGSSAANSANVVGVNIDSLPDPSGTNYDRYGSPLIVSEGIVPIITQDVSPTIPSPVWLSPQYPRGVVTTVKPATNAVQVGVAIADLGAFTENLQGQVPPELTTVSGRLLRVQLGPMNATTGGSISGALGSVSVNAINDSGGAAHAIGSISASQIMVTDASAHVTTASTIPWTDISGAPTFLGDPGANGMVVRTSSGTTTARTLTSGGTISISNPDGVAGNPGLDVATNGIGNAQLRQGAALSVIGRSVNSIGNDADISATGGTQCLQTNSGGTAVVWAACPSSGGGGTIIGPLSGDAITPTSTSGVVSVVGITDSGSHDYPIGSLSASQCLAVNGAGTGIVSVACSSGGVSSLTATDPSTVSASTGAVTIGTKFDNSSVTLNVGGALQRAHVSGGGLDIPAGSNTSTISGLTISQITPPTGIGLWGITGGASDAAATAVSTGLQRTAGVLTADLSTGVSGGQTAIGGTASGNSLTLSSTSNATKGQIKFGTTAAYDEAAGQFLGPAGSLTVPSYSFEGFPGNGFGTILSGARISVYQAGARIADFLPGEELVIQSAGTGIIDVSGGGGAQLRSSGSFLFVLGPSGIAFNTAALATTATTPFLELMSMPGVPTGTPATIASGQVPVVVDSTDKRLYAYSGGAWGTWAQLDSFTGPVCSAVITGVHGVCSASALASAQTWPAATQVLVSAGTASAPVGDTHFTYDTLTHTLTSSGTTILGTTTGIAHLSAGTVGPETLTALTGLLESGGTLSGVAFVGSGLGHAMGMVPDPGSTAGAVRFVREDGTWADPSSSITFQHSTSIPFSLQTLNTTAICGGWLFGTTFESGSSCGAGFSGSAVEFPTGGLIPANVRMQVEVTSLTMSGTYNLKLVVTRNGTQVSPTACNFSSSSGATPFMCDQGGVGISGGAATDVFGVEAVATGSGTASAIDATVNLTITDY